ncbi:MAG: tetratricopeptide repeat protein [Chloroflexota bacterium]
MGKIAVLIFLGFLAALGFLAVENKELVSVKVPFVASVYEMPKIALMLLSSTVGALVVLVVFFIRDTKRVIDNMQFQKRQKREARVQEFYSKALNALLGHKEDEAREALGDILKEDPEHLDALLRVGDVAYGNEDYKTALDYYRKARDVSPKHLQTLLSLVAVMKKLGKNDEALKCLEEILELDSENLTALIEKREILEKKDKWDELVSLQRSVIKLEHSEREKVREERRLLGYKYEYARASLENGEPEKAEKTLRTVLKIDGSFIPAYLGIAEVMVMKGETEEAINFLEKGFGQLRSPILLARLEDLLISVGEPGRLIRFYKNALSRSPNDHLLRFMLGKAYCRLEMIDDAIEMLNSVDTAVIAAGELFGLRGELYLKRNQVQKAAEEFRRACGVKDCLRVPYRCSNCGGTFDEWSGRCAECGGWNTYAVELGEIPRS